MLSISQMATITDRPIGDFVAKKQLIIAAAIAEICFASKQTNTGSKHGKRIFSIWLAEHSMLNDQYLLFRICRQMHFMD